MTDFEVWLLFAALVIAPVLLSRWLIRLPPGPLDQYPEDDE
jgi:hypothetical protein